MKPNPSRKTRTKIRKPKFLSLRRELAAHSSPDPAEMSSATSSAGGGCSNQLDLFPLHPEHHLTQDKDPHVACLLEPDDGAGGATLTALLGIAGSPASEESLSPPSPPSSSMNWDGDRLARRALRGRERWVFCSSPEEEEEGSSGVDLWCGVPQSLSLKLDYEEILSAWSDKGSLYIEGEGPQVVPEFHHTYAHDSPAPTVFVDVGCTGSGRLWRVPELGGRSSSCGAAMEEEVEDRTVGRSREARVMRYREKRQSRLFSKRIRYEVRKLNAEKRPRMKGRFVKRKDGA